MIRYLVALAFLILASPAIAQDETPQEERGLFTSFLENQLSTPNRQIRVSGIQGVLSSNARIGQITVADREGIWLRITNASIEWSRTALIFRQRLEISTLSAERIDVLRQPLPDESLPAPEAGGFAVPELPVAVNLGSLEVPLATFGPTVFGLESQLSLAGRLRLEDGSLDTALNVTRLDGPGGQLALTLAYANATEVIDLDLSLSEPDNGVVANLLDIEGRPPVDLRLAGAGPLSALDVDLALDAAQERVLTGTAQLRENEDGLGFATRLAGPIAQLVPAQFRDFFGAETALQANGVVKDEGGVRVDQLALRSAELALDASAETSADGFLRRLAIDAGIGDESDSRVVLPVPGGDTTIERARLTLSYGEGQSDDWAGTLDVDGLNTPTVSAARTQLVLDGLAQNLDQPDSRRITFDIDGAVDGVTSPDEEIAQALGERMTLDISGSWDAGQPIALDALALEAEALALTLAGSIAEFVFDGSVRVETSSIAPFSGLAGRDLSGALTLDAQGTLAALTGGFDLGLDGRVEELRIDNDAADNLMDGTTTITGRIARGEDGLSADELRVANDQFELNADGTFATGTADFSYALALSDLALLSEQAAGRVEAEGRAVGSEGLITLTTALRAPAGRLADRTLRDATLAFEGQLQDGNLDGTVAGSAFLDGTRVDLSSAIALVDNERRLNDLVFTAGGARLAGDLVQLEDGLIDATLEIDAADISTAAALALLEATGAVQASVRLQPANGVQNADISAQIRNFRLDDTAIETADLTAAIEDLFGVPMIEGDVEAGGIAAGGVEVSTLRAAATRQGDITDFDADARLDNGTTIATAGRLQPEDGGFRLTLDRADLAQNELAAGLRQPASLLVAGETIVIDALQLDVGGGTVQASGRIAEALDLDVSISRLPLSIANTVRPDLELGGMIDGTAAIGGTRDDPQVSFDINGQSIVAAALRQAGLSSLAVEARGTTTGERLDVTARVNSPEGLNLSASGGVPLGDGQIALDVQLAAFPLSILNTVVPDQDLAGTLTGTAQVTGTTADPRAAFDLRAAGLGAAPLRDAGIASLEATAAGTFADNAVALSALNVQGPQGLTLSASGNLPLEGPGLSVNLSGAVPLELANQFLVDQGTQVSGTLQLEGNVTGSIQDPQINGTVSAAGAQVVDPSTNVALRDINVAASIAGQTVTLTSATASVQGGGTISASGTASLDAAADFPVNIAVNVNQARYTDGELVVAIVSGNLAFVGPATGDARLTGQIDIERAEITVPDTFGGAGAAIDVTHRNPPPAVAETLRRARADDGTPVPTSRPSVISLDVQINAPNQIFVRGRGLDAELGGSIRIVGPVTDVQPVGALELIRGRLGILGQRIDFDEGSITLVGDLDPVLNLVARTTGSDITVFITVSGRVSDIDVAFSSQPELPEDEVLARLIFNRGIGELSPLQIAQLAAAAAELAGGSDTSLFGSLRQATGLDDLDIVTDSEGNAAVRAGRYIQDNIYLGVEAGAGGTASATINLDITDELKARGAVGTESSLGLYFERDY